MADIKNSDSPQIILQRKTMELLIKVTFTHYFNGTQLLSFNWLQRWIFATKSLAKKICSKLPGQFWNVQVMKQNLKSFEVKIIFAHKRLFSFFLYVFVREKILSLWPHFLNSLWQPKFLPIFAKFIFVESDLKMLRRHFSSTDNNGHTLFAKIFS